jgi:hypothetical protein
MMPDHEAEHNPQNWVAVYSGGRPIFKEGEYHPFLDIIEQCDARNRDEYDRAVTIAEEAFTKAGKAVSIDHQTTIAMVIGAADDKTRVGLIFRNPMHSSTFNFNVEPGLGSGIKRGNADPHQCLLHAAAWLETVQLSVTAGFYKAKRGNLLQNAAPLKAVQGRLGKLNGEIAQIEDAYTVSYRPERPNPMDLIDEAARYAQGIRA